MQGGVTANKLSTTQVRDALQALHGSYGEYRTRQIFIAGGIWNKPAGLKRVRVVVVGGGGPGGGAPATAAAQISARPGGAAAGTAIQTIGAALLGAPETVKSDPLKA